MKGIYLTEEAKAEIEAKIAELELVNKTEIENKWEVKAGVTYGFIYALKKILSSATILPVYESLGHAMQNKDLDNPNGLIIQPK
jgi:hypothetical protein